MSRYMQMKVFVLGIWILFFCLIAHWMACIWYVLAMKFDQPGKTKHSWLRLLSEITNEPYNFTLNGDVVAGTGPTMASLYISALYYTMSSLTTCGFGNIAPNTSAEKFFGCVTMLVGCVLYAFIFGQVTNIISQMQKNSNTYAEQLGAIKQFNSIYRVPRDVATRVEDYYRATWAVTKGTDEEEILKTCPRDLQSDLCLHIHEKIFKNRAFANVNNTALRVLSRYLWTIRTSPGDKLVYQGESIDTIYFIATGSLEVKHGQELLGLIGPGDVFGRRLSIENDQGRSLYDVEACSFGAIHCILCDNVQEALHLYPEEFEKLKYGLILSFDITKQIKMLNKFGEEYSTELPESMKEKETLNEVNIYTAGDDVTALDHTPNIDVLSGMSEIKGELRRETERMNSKMGVVESQMRLILKLLRGHNKIAIDPEIGSQLNELLTEETKEGVDDEYAEWFVADSHGWKEPPPANNKPTQSVIVNVNATEDREGEEITPRSLPTVPPSSQQTEIDKDERLQAHVAVIAGATKRVPFKNIKKQTPKISRVEHIDESTIETIKL